MRKIIIICSGLLLATGLFFIVKSLIFYQKVYTPKKIIFSKTTDKLKTDYNILLLGYGGPGHDGAYLTDTMMVLHLDIKTHKATLISIPRDIWVKLPTKSGTPFGAKINTVYQTELFPETFPDVDTKNELTKSILKQVTGLEMDNYIAIDFSAFRQAINILGGVDINVVRAFTDDEYPLDGKQKDLCGKEEKDLPELEKIATESPELAFPCRYEKLDFSIGVQHMDADRALKFVRSRHSDQDGGDFNRAARQQLFIDAIKEKILSVGFLPKIPTIMDEFANHMKTDISPTELKKYLSEAQKAEKYEVKNLVLSDNEYIDFGRSEDGQSILLPKAGLNKWSQVHTWIAKTIKRISPTPTKIRSN